MLNEHCGKINVKQLANSTGQFMTWRPFDVNSFKSEFGYVPRWV